MGIASLNPSYELTFQSHTPGVRSRVYRCGRSIDHLCVVCLS